MSKLTDIMDKHLGIEVQDENLKMNSVEDYYQFLLQEKVSVIKLELPEPKVMEFNFEEYMDEDPITARKLRSVLHNQMAKKAIQLSREKRRALQPTDIEETMQALGV